MCVIIDNCVASIVYLQPNDADYRLVREAIMANRLIVVYGGELRREYESNTSVMRFVKALDQAGKAMAIADRQVDDANAEVESSGICQSNDTHIIALAIVAGSRLLCSADQGLHSDFKNHKLLKQPRGKVFQNATHAALLNRKCKTCNKFG
jgi:predicted nucleic acid-binding protein